MKTRKASSRSKQYLVGINSKPKTRKEFFVDPNRLELDEYMLKQIKKNKHSVRSLNKEVTILKKEVRQLQEHHDDYMLLERTKTQDHTQSHVTVQKQKHNNRVAFTQKEGKESIRSQQRLRSKDNSVLSLSSSIGSSRKSSVKSMKNRSSCIQGSKQRLNRKIEELKAKACLQDLERDNIKRQVKRKIKKACELIEQKKQQKSSKDLEVQNLSVDPDYNKLLELLQTTKSFKNTQTPEINSIESSEKQLPIKLSHKKQPSLHFQLEEKDISPVAIQSAANIRPKINHYQIEDLSPRKILYQESNLKSETNLLESSPSRSIKQSPKQPKKTLQMSRCLEYRIVNENVQSSISENSGFDGIFGSPAEIRSNSVELSFQGSDSSKKRLRELQFEFDQLVRQQLMATDSKQKQMLGQTIRSVLWSISELKGKIQRQSR